MPESQNVLIAEVQPEEFVPYIEYKFKTKYYQWIGAGRDGDNNLTPLCAQWIASLPALPHLRKEVLAIILQM